MAKPARQVDYEKLGRNFEDVVVKNYVEFHNTGRQIWLSFIKGIFAGLGGVIGATVMVAILLAVLHRLGGLPVIGHYLNNVGQTIQQRK